MKLSVREYLKSVLAFTADNLGRHFEILADEGLVTIIKGYEEGALEPGPRSRQPAECR